MALPLRSSLEPPMPGIKTMMSLVMGDTSVLSGVPSALVEPAPHCYLHDAGEQGESAMNRIEFQAGTETTFDDNLQRAVERELQGVKFKRALSSRLERSQPMVRCGFRQTRWEPTHHSLVPRSAIN